MPGVPAETIQVARFGPRDATAESKPGTKAWLLNSKAGGENSIRLWTTPEFLEEIQATYPQLQDLAITTPKGGFVEGRPLMNKAITIKSCGEGGRFRPKRFYRVVHSDIPFDGIKARGSGILDTNPITFQNLLQKHMIWTCRWPSPFMSATDSPHLVALISAFHQIRGRSGIKVLMIDTTSPQWLPQQRIWNMGYLAGKFDPRYLAYGHAKREYLIEDSIPPECVVKRQDWGFARSLFDPWDDVYRMMDRKFENQQSRTRKRARDDEQDEENKNDDVDHIRPTHKRTTRFKVGV